MPPATLVLGSGVIGLRTALLLSRAGARVSVRSAGPSASGASPGAGGLWMPHACGDPRVSRWASRTLADYLRMHAAGDAAVELVPAVALLDAPAVRPTGDTNTYNQPAGGDAPAWAADPALGFQSFSTPQLRWQAQVTGAHVPAVAGEYGNAWAWRGPVVDAPRNLGDMEREIVERGGRIDKESAFESADEALAAAERDGCEGVVNCLGGAGGLLTGDGGVKLARGVLKIYKRVSAGGRGGRLRRRPAHPPTFFLRAREPSRRASTRPCSSTSRPSRPPSGRSTAFRGATWCSLAARTWRGTWRRACGRR